MCASTDTEGKNRTSIALHLSSSTSSSSPMIGESCSSNNNNNNNSNHSPISSYASLFEVDDEDDDDTRDLNYESQSQSQLQASQRARRRPSLALSEDGVDQSPHNSSFIVNENNNNNILDADGVSEVSAAGNNGGSSSRSQVKVESSNFCAEMIMLPTVVCQGSSDFAEQMDIFMRCQHPLDILGMFHEDEVDGGSGDIIDPSHHCGGGGADGEPHRVSGYHALPRTCEYCGSQNIDLCKENSKCDRPKSFFPRENPPFCPKGGSKREEEEEDNVGVALNEEVEVEDIKQTGFAEENGPKMACSAWI